MKLGRPLRFDANPNQVADSLREEHVDVLRWGLVPSWAKDLKIGSQCINARAEMVMSRLAFRDAFKRRRCLVPADGFYEWKREGKAKQPHAIMAPEGEIFGFAGLWENWKDPVSQEWIRTFSILTGSPNDLVSPIHDRMPVVIPPEAYGRWLGEEEVSTDELTAMLTPWPADRMRVWTVSLRVNSVKNNDADLLARLEARDCVSA